MAFFNSGWWAGERFAGWVTKRIGELFKECMMKSFKQSLVKFLKSEDGPTAVEYAVMVALIIVVAIGAVTLLGQKTSETFNTTATKISGS